MIRYFQT